MNTIRKHLSAIQGGRLALASPAPVLALVISDVTGDDPTHIASGSLLAGSDDLPGRDRHPRALRRGGPRPRSPATSPRGAAGEIAETPKPGDQGFARVETRVIATAHQSLMAAAAYVQQRGAHADGAGRQRDR